MRVRVRFAAILKVHGIASGDSLELPEGGSLAALLGRLGVPGNQQGYVLARRNGRRVRLEEILHDGDDLELYLPVGGG